MQGRRKGLKQRHGAARQQLSLAQVGSHLKVTFLPSFLCHTKEAAERGQC